MTAHHEEEVLGKAYDARLLRRLLGYLRPYRAWVFFSVASIILHSALATVGPFLTKVAVDKYLKHTTRQPTFLDPFFSPLPFVGLVQVAAVYLLVLVLSFALQYAQTYAMQITGQKLMFDLRMEIFTHLQRLHMAFFDRNPVGRLVTRVTTDVNVLNETFTSGVVTVFGDIFTLAFILIVMLQMDARLALATFAVLPLIALATRVFRARVRDSYRRIRTAIARINAYLQEHITGVSVLQLFNREEKSFAEFEQVNRRHMDAFKDAIFAHAVFYPTIEVLSATAVALILWYGGLQVLDATMTIGIVVAFIQYAQRFYRPILDLSEKYNLLQEAMASSERIFKLLDTPPEIASPAEPVKPERPRGRVEFRHVWFAYKNVPEAGAEPATAKGTSPQETRPVEAAGVHPAATPKDGSAGLAISAEDAALVEEIAESAALEGVAAARAAGSDGAIQRERFSLAGAETAGAVAAKGASLDGAGPKPGEPDWVLKDVSFTVEPGETVAIVGHTGAGKTTIISLLLRFYDVQKGEILLDGVDLRRLDLARVRRQFGVVLQDPFLFSGTVADNIRLGSPQVSRADVEEAAAEVNLAEFIRSLPNGFDEEVRERGSRLSTGQKQLISFARALAHKPRLLVLDEATSSVDTETEHRVREALSHMIEGRTSVIIAHRLSTVQRADRILVMHKGRLRESGTHQELLAERGIYWKLYQLQYKDQEVSVAGND